MPEAKTYDEQPLTFAQSWRQRCRWSVGLIQCLRVYGPRLIRDRHCANGQLHARLDQILFLFAPLFQLMYLIAMTGILGALQIHYAVAPYSDVLYEPLMSLAMSFVGTVVLAMAVIVLERKPLLNMGKGVLGYWLFVMSWIPINIVALCNPNLEWKAIPHTRSLRMDQLKDTGAMKGVKMEKSR